MAPAVLAVCAGAIGNSWRVRLKEGWEEPAVIWVAVIGESGAKKSPVLDLAVEPLHAVQKKNLKRHEEKLQKYEQVNLCYQKELNRWNRNGSGDQPVKPELPVADRIYCSDTTIEALAGLLKGQPRGMIVYTDELSGWIRSFDQYKSGKGRDVASWLEMHRAGPITIDRKTTLEGVLHIPHAAVSVVGGIQPGVLMRVLGRDHFENGLAARILMSFPASRPQQWTEDGISVQERQAYAAIVESLYATPLEVDADGELRPGVIELDPEAKAVWVEYFNGHATEMAGLSGPLSSAWSKLEGYTVRIALVIHCVLMAEDPSRGKAIDSSTMEAAVKISQWFGDEAKRVYELLSSWGAKANLQMLLDKVRANGGRVTVREWMRIRSKGTTLEARQELQSLVDAGMGQLCKEGGQGRPSWSFVLTN